MASKRKQPRSWSDRLNPAEAAEPEQPKELTIEEEMKWAAQKMADSIMRDLDRPPPPGLPMGLSEALKPTPDQIKIKCLQRELYLAKAKILELELRADGVKI